MNPNIIFEAFVPGTLRKPEVAAGAAIRPWSNGPGRPGGAKNFAAMTRWNFIRSRLLAGPPSWPWTVLLAAAFILAPTLLRLAADNFLQDSVFSAYFPFIVFAALVLGWQWAALVAGIAGMVANYLFMTPRYILFAAMHDTVGVLYFWLSCALIIAIVDTLRLTIMELDETTRREAGLNAQMQHLNRELQHRVRNILSVVQGLSLYTLRDVPGAEETARKLAGRLQALAEAQTVLTSGKWELCRLPDLVDRAVAPFNGQGAVRFAGPTCGLPEASCVPLVLALHELGTNAVKYGALSRLEGQVEICWEVLSGPGPQDRLALSWVEKGGPPVQAPTRRGLGSRLIAPQTGIGEVMMEYRPEGLQCRIVVADAKLLPGGPEAEESAPVTPPPDPGGAPAPEKQPG
jgi:two-component sensor histidine kinase